MITYITRTTKTTIIYSAEVQINGDNEAILINQKADIIQAELTMDKSIKQLNKIYGKNHNRIITKLDVKEELRGMTIDDFIKHSVLMQDARTPMKPDVAVGQNYEEQTGNNEQ